MFVKCCNQTKDIFMLAETPTTNNSKRAIANGSNLTPLSTPTMN